LPTETRPTTSRLGLTHRRTGSLGVRSRKIAIPINPSVRLSVPPAPVVVSTPTPKHGPRQLIAALAVIVGSARGGVAGVGVRRERAMRCRAHLIVPG
jgi:hypothetical protein